MSRAQGSPLLNCTWREIPLNSSWQRLRTGRHIKQSLSRSPINTSHSLASLQTSPPPRPSLCAPSCNAAEPGRAFNVMFSRGARFLILSAHHWLCVIFHPARPEHFYSFPASHRGRLRGRGFLHIHLWRPVRHQMSEAAPEGGQEATCKARGKKKKRKRKKERKKSHVKHICNINTCFDLISLITVYSSTFKSFRKRSEE